MFQTEPVHYLQTIENSAFATLMDWVTQLGYSEFYIPLVIIVAVGVNLRKGMLVVHMLHWNGVFTDFAKDYFALPRPSDLDTGAQSFWSRLDPDVVEQFRATPTDSYGFPSGHVSSTATLWGGFFALFRSMPVRLLCIALILLMPVSRMYLGRHFLADVLGGLLLGGTVVAATYALLLRAGGTEKNFDRQLDFTDRPRAFYALVAYLLLVPFAFLAVFPLFEADEAGRLFGIDLGIIVILYLGLPSDAASLPRRVLRVALALLVFGLMGAAVDSAESALLAQTAPHLEPTIEFVAAGIPPLVCLVATILGGQKLGLYTPWPKPA